MPRSLDWRVYEGTFYFSPLTSAPKQTFNKHLLRCQWKHLYLYFTSRKRKLAVIQFNGALTSREYQNGKKYNWVGK